MAKGKKSTGTSSGPRRAHGPKTHIHKDYKPKPLVMLFGKLGLLSKYYDFESWQLACAARGKKNFSKAEFDNFCKLSRDQQDEYFKNLKK